jgi:MEMO1 family protein
MSKSTDEEEHSLEMHLPYISKMLQASGLYTNANRQPPLVPILVGSIDPKQEAEFGKILAPYLADEHNVFVVSSDFCHWGSRFRYTAYLPSGDASDGSDKISLSSSKRKPKGGPEIHESIAQLDKLSIEAVESGIHAKFSDNMKSTGNTVCGRHPIGVIMAGLEYLRNEQSKGEDWGRFKFVRYERSSDAVDHNDSSVSYASAFAIV